MTNNKSKFILITKALDLSIRYNYISIKNINQMKILYGNDTKRFSDIEDYNKLIKSAEEAFNIT